MVGLQLTGQTLFKILASGTFTVPEVVNVASPTSDYLTKSLDTKRQVAGGQLYGAITDEAGVTQDINIELFPRDVIAVGAIAAGLAAVTINGTRVFTLGTGTAAFVALQGFYS